MNKILVIDDEAPVRKMLSTLLTVEGYTVKAVENGIEGLEVMDTFKPQVVILDLQMPKMGGTEFLKCLKLKMDMSCSVIVLTGHGKDEDIGKCYQLGIQTFLRKPVNIHEILGLVRRNFELINFSKKLRLESEKTERINRILQKTFDGMSEGAVVLDDNFAILMISDKACQILGISMKKALNQAAVAVLGKTVAGASGILMKIADSLTVTSKHQTYLLSSTGANIPVYITIKKMKGLDAKFGWLLLFRDKREEERQVREQAGGISFGRMISNDVKMMEIFSLIDNVASSNATVLITGDTGTGKELVAREIHDRSQRAQKPFHVVNCAAIPLNLIESEIFGHERGSFTGAIKSKPGRFELANGGTLFMDEIGEMSLEMQVKLLRVLQEQTFERVGGTRSIQVDVRIIVATNQELTEMVQQKRFREDLFYRLDVVTIKLPPLRSRLQDIPLLVSYFIKNLNETEHRKVADVSPEVTLQLLSYTWPGNVRELYHVIEYAFVVSNGNILQFEHLPDKVKDCVISSQENISHTNSERDSILEALEQTSYNKKKAAGLLGVSLSTLYRKVKKHQIGIKENSLKLNWQGTN